MCGGHFVRMLVPLTTKPAEQVVQIPAASAAALHTLCPVCGAAITPGFLWCPKCGAALKAHACAYCGQAINPGEKACDFCGAPANKR